MFIGRTDAEAETPILWPPHAKSWLIGKDPDAGRDCRQEEKGMTEDEMAGWHHRLNAHESGWTLGAGDGQGGLACCSSWGRKESDTTERLNWTELKRLDLNSSNYKKKIVTVWWWMLTSLIAAIILQHIHVLNHYFCTSKTDTMLCQLYCSKTGGRGEFTPLS